MRILVTRPPPGGPRTATRLRALGHEVLELPVLAVAATGAAVPEGSYDAIVLTSANGLLAFRPETMGEFSTVPVIAVGERTGEAARAHGFSQVTAAGGDALDMGAMAAAQLPKGARVLYPAGVVRKPDLESALRQAGFAVAVLEAYDAVAVDPASLGAGLRKDQPDIVLHYSRASAEAWLAGARASGHEAALLAGSHLVLSAEAGAPLLAAGAARVLAAERPDEDALFALLDRLPDATAPKGSFG